MRRAWWSLVLAHPGAYLRHRAAVMLEVLGLTREPTWEPVAQTFAGNAHQLDRIHHHPRLSPFQRTLGDFYREHLGDGPLFKPWLYALAAMILLADAIRRRDRAIAALLGGALLYEASFFIGAAAPDFRYSHWMVLCTCVAIIVATSAHYRRAFTGTRDSPRQEFRRRSA